MNKLMNTVHTVLQRTDLLGLWLALLSWDYFESGLEKFQGENWFAEIRQNFPFPFNVVPPAVSWQLATWFELTGGVALVLGLATRFFSVSLIVLTVVAMLSVHWPAAWATWAELMQGYVFTDKGMGNFKLPVLFIGMFLPLVFMGPGRLSVDHWLRVRWLGR